MRSKLRRLYYWIIYRLRSIQNHQFYNKKIKRLLRANNFKSDILTSTQKNEIKTFFESYGFKNVNCDWHRFYTNFSGNYFKSYIPESIFANNIEPALNNKLKSEALDDKNIFDFFLGKQNLPKSIVKCTNGCYYGDNGRLSFQKAADVCSKYDSFIIKPSIDSGGGRGVQKIELESEENRKNTVEELFSTYGLDFIVQEVIKQNEILASLNPTSINSMRILTYLREDEVVILSSVIRIGRKGQVVDNQNSGGIACGIDANGVLQKFGFNKAGEKFIKSDSGIKFAGFVIPQFEDILSKVKQHHEQLPYFKLISWDATVDVNNSILIIEYNCRGQGITMHQKANGPLFGKYSDEILKQSLGKRLFNNVLHY